MKNSEAIRIHLDNVEEFSRRAQISALQRDFEISELIDIVVRSSDSGDCHRAYNCLTELLPSATLKDKAMLCLALAASPKHSEELRKRSFLTRDSIPAGAHGKISIVRNKYNEAAYGAFSETVSNPKAVYASSFTEACEDVFDGRCEFCILPVENSQSGRLFGFYSMLDRYELKICALCELDGADPAESTHYALVGRSRPNRIPKRLAWRFECAVIWDSGTILGDISSFCQAFEARLKKADSLSVEYNEQLKKYYFTFEVSEKGLVGFDLLLSEEYATYVPLGLYPVVAKKGKNQDGKDNL